MKTHRCAVVLLGCLYLYAAAGTTWHVDKNHDRADDANPGTRSLPWKTLQHAFDASAVVGGDTVVVMPGLYDSVTLSNTIKKGSAGRPILVTGYRRPDTSSISPQLYSPAQKNSTPPDSVNNAVVNGGFFFHHFVSRSIGYIEIRNFELCTTPGYRWRNFLYADGVTNIRIDSCYIHDISGLFTSHANDSMTISQNRLWRVEGVNLSLYGYRCLVYGNHVSHPVSYVTYSGTEVVNDADFCRPLGHDLIFRKNYLHSAVSSEIRANSHTDAFQSFVYDARDSVYNIVIDSNIVDSNVDGQACMIEDTWEKNHRGQNLLHGFRIWNNVFARIGINNANAILAHDFADSMDIQYNTFFKCPGYPVDFEDTACCQLVKHNIFYSFRSPGHVLGPLFLDKSDSGSILDSNLYFPRYDVPASRASGKLSGSDANSIADSLPRFLDSANIMGADGAMWTADDGLRVTRQWPFAAGAYRYGPLGGVFGAASCKKNGRSRERRIFTFLGNSVSLPNDRPGQLDAVHIYDVTGKTVGYVRCGNRCVIGKPGQCRKSERVFVVSMQRN